MAEALYASWPENARRSWGFGAIAVLIGTFVLAFMAAAIPAVAMMVVELAGGADPESVDTIIAEQTAFWLLPSILIQFGLWGWLVWMWVSRFERRGLASIGIVLSVGAMLRYLIGLALGVGLVFAIGSVGMLLGGLEPGSDPSASASAARLAEPYTLLFLAAIIVIFLIQGGSEELIFRGWLMSALAARWGVRTGTIVSSLCFMILHAHVFFSGWLFGSVVLVGLGLMGLMFALFCLVTRSIIEAIAAHGAFNATTIVVATAAMLIDNPELGLSEILGSVFATSTGTAGADVVQFAPAQFAQGLTAGTISAVLVVALIARGRKPTQDAGLTG